MQRLIIVRDSTREDALKQWMHERPAHLDETAELQPEHHVLTGGALTRDDRRRVGTVAVARAQSCNELGRWLKMTRPAAYDSRRGIMVHASQMALQDNVLPCLSNTIGDDG